MISRRALSLRVSSALRWAVGHGGGLVVVSVAGESMAPAYRSGDWVLVLRRPGTDVRRDEVVVVERPEPGHGWDRLPPPAAGAPTDAVTGRRWYIKRVAAVAGDPVPEAVASAAGTAAGTAVRDATVPPGRLVLLGDNAPSDDSTRWGYFPAERVLGVAVRRLRRWPR